MTADNISYTVSVLSGRGDGIADLAVANLGSSNVAILIGNGDGTFGEAVYY